MKIFQKLFSAKNIGIHKEITVCGIKLKFKSKKLIERERLRLLELRILQLNDRIENQVQIYNQQIQELNNKNTTLQENVVNLQNILEYYLTNLNDNTLKKHDKVIYTCITGSYDDLIQHRYIDKDYDYICFTDNENLLKKRFVGCWQIKPLVFNKLDNTRNNRWHKINYFNCVSEYKESIYVDANIDILTDYIFKTFAESQKKILIPMHYRNDCVFQECDYVLECQREFVEKVEEVREFLKSQNMPEHYGLTENNIIYRDHSWEILPNMMKDWFECVEKRSKRDQLSCSYVMWKNGVKISDITIPNARVDTANFRMYCHTKK